MSYNYDFRVQVYDNNYKHHKLTKYEKFNYKNFINVIKEESKKDVSFYNIFIYEFNKEIDVEKVEKNKTLYNDKIIKVLYNTKSVLWVEIKNNNFTEKQIYDIVKFIIS